MRGSYGKCGQTIARARSGVPPGRGNATASTNASVQRRTRTEPHQNRSLARASELALRSGLWFQQLRKAEVVAPELGISHFAIAAEVDAIKAAAETLDVAVGERRRELCEHRPPQLEPFIGEVAAVMVVVDHHQRPCPGDEVAARERGQPPG